MSRLLSNGSPALTARSSHAGKVCDVEGCDTPRRKRAWCATHYNQWRLTGQAPAPLTRKWRSETSGPCLHCDAPVEGRRLYCSDACGVRRRAAGGVTPSATCVACGTAIDLMEVGKRGQRRKRTVKFCRPCKQDYNKYKLSARELAERDGTDCGICGDPVDMTLRKRDDSRMCPSVDHILPRSLGGTHEPENLQLAHLYCNQQKSDRVGAVGVVGVI